MNKLLIFCILFLSGCSVFKAKVEYVEVSYPILVCPAPPKMEMPSLYISKLTKADYKNYGKISKYYDITIEQLVSYIKSLEMVIDRYDKTSDEYKKLEKEFNMNNKEIKWN